MPGGSTHRQQRLGSVAGEDVADAHTPVSEQAATVTHPGFDVRRILGMVGDGEPVGFLLIPTERGYRLAVAVQDAGLACRCRGGQLRSPLRDAVAAGADTATERGQ